MKTRLSCIIDDETQTNMKTPRIFRFLVHLLFDEELRVLFLSVLVVLFVGTIAYAYLEGLHPFDAFYFSAITLTTIGFGDIAPHTIGGKLFTIIYIFFGLVLMLSTINIVTYQLIRHEQEELRRSKRLKIKSGQSKK